MREERQSKERNSDLYLIFNITKHKKILETQHWKYTKIRKKTLFLKVLFGIYLPYISENATLTFIKAPVLIACIP